MFQSVMISEREELRHQSEEHPLVPTTDFSSIEAYVLYLVHRAAYEEAARRARDAVVLDIGCNNGYGTVIVANQSRSTIGVDVSPRAVESAQRYNPRENVRYQLIDGLSLPFDDGSFDLVTSFQVIEHISNVERYLAEIRRVLRPGGTGLLTTPNRCIRLDPCMKPWNEFHVREYEASELRALLLPFFDDVQVQGLFAVPAVYEIEYERAQRGLASSRRQNKPAYKAKRLLRAALRKFAPSLLQRLQSARGTPESSDAHAQALAPEILARHSTAEFWYSEADVDRALDLLAICEIAAKA
ncbi:MAG: class I SAM-dependent methyltransferase [Candidatus Eremiobacteraeota bacterium]|nr:class I SAM-dependent methyltransferase [Candidatus Eremiobacteraeota bacterium]